MCIDKVAETLSSPKSVEYLLLPKYIKEKIAKVVFDPDVDFCYCYESDEVCNKQTFDYDTIHRTACKNIISTARYSTVQPPYIITDI